MGYCAEYVVMRFKDDCVHDEDQHHHDQADWLDIQEGKIHAIPTKPKNGQARGIAPNKELCATHEVTGHSEIPAKDVVPMLPPEHKECQAQTASSG